MKISAVSSYNYNNSNQNKAVNKNDNNISFGRFRDENAEMELEKVVRDEIAQNEYAQYYAPPKLDILKNSDIVDIYTDEKTQTGKIRVEYDEKKINADGRQLDRLMRWYDDLRSYQNLARLAGHVNIMTNIMLGIKPKYETMDPREEMRIRREEEARQEEKCTYPYLAF